MHAFCTRSATDRSRSWSQVEASVEVRAFFAANQTTRMWWRYMNTSFSELAPTASPSATTTLSASLSLAFSTRRRLNSSRRTALSA